MRWSSWLQASAAAGAPLKPLAVSAEVNVSDVRAVTAAGANALQTRLKLVDVNGIVMRGDGQQLSIRAGSSALQSNNKLR